LTKRKRKDGRVLDVSVTISPVQDASGKIIGASAIARDVTARESARKKALRIREEFISVAAHELRTPLTTLYARLQLIERRLARQDLEPEAVRRDVTLVRKTSDRLKTLIDRLLDISRIRSGQLQLELEATDIATMPESVVLTIAEPSGRKITLQASPPLKSYRAAVDGVRVEEVIVNLIDNAVKYSPEDTAIDGQLSSTPEAIRVGVRARGPGVRLEERERIFEPFHRSSDTAPGVGLGLHIAREIVELHGGTLTLEEPADGGSRFVVMMPRG